VYNRTLILLTMNGHLLTGRTGEEIAEKYLQAQGYSMLGRNVKTGRGEVDLIAKKDGVIVFVEVKARTKNDGFAPSDRINPAKVQRLLGAAELWLSKQSEEFPARIDVIGVCEGRVVEHYEDITS